jgi:iron-sulfur cluster assembly protein
MITLTESAANQIKKSLANRGKGVGIRLGVKTSGCSGLAYMMEFCDKTDADDLITTMFEATLVVDAKSVQFLDGTELDYTKEGLNEGFKFNNPNSVAECGCGESFTVKA